MLGRLRQVHKLSPFEHGDHAKPANPAAARQPEIASSAMKIIHAGGRIECYYMATPAARILEKYPSHYLAKPEVFRRPWDSVVRREKILIPGQKQPSKELSSVSSASRASNDTSVDMVSRQNIDVPSSSFFSQSDISVSRDTKRSCRSALRKETGVKKHVRFTCFDVKHKAADYSTNSEKKGIKVEDSSLKSSSNVSQSHGRKRRPRNSAAWQPSLTVISES
ncbi:hypothetical protein POPTR_014G170000v4 [Populus trichocarpa]|uniref:Uncharacterized protein n=1 Tax=Populus trichocarpa TaxID=3694 RepID=A0ACC0RZQ7_POPTR|nr:hypothetical protein POPTR_014G170000v4 [Populus trichocarpa]